MTVRARGFQRALQKIVQFVKRVRKAGPVELGDPASEKWEDLGRELLHGLKAAIPQNRRLLLLVDELPVFLLQLLRRDPTGGRAGTFLHWFRELRQRPELASKVRWLLAGSIGLDNIAPRWGLSQTINDLQEVRDVGAFSEEEADALLQAWSQSCDLPLDEPTRARLLDRVGWLIPYHLQILFSAILDARGGNAIPSPALVDLACNHLISGDHYFGHWVERLRVLLGTPDDQQAMEILYAAARAPGGVTFSTLQAALDRHIAEPEVRDQKLWYLLGVLRGDGYLIKLDDYYRFRSAMLGDYWVRRFGLKTSNERPSLEGN